MKIKKHLAVLLALCLAVAPLAACGNKDANKTTDTEAPTVSVTEPETTVGESETTVTEPETTVGEPETTEPEADTEATPVIPADALFISSIDHVNGMGPNGAANFAGRGGNYVVGIDVIDAITEGVPVNADGTLAIGGWLGVNGGTLRFVFSVDGGVTWNEATGGYDGEPLPGHYAGQNLTDATKMGMFHKDVSPVVADLTAYAGQTLTVYFGAVCVSDGETVVPFVGISNYTVPTIEAEETTTETEAEVETVDPAYVEVSLSEAKNLPDDTLVIVKGTVTEINTPWNSTFGNITVTITDDSGETLYIYRLATEVAVGDIVTITGKVGSYNDAKQIAAGATAEITGHEDVAGPDYQEVSIPEAIALPDDTWVIVKGTVTKINTEWSDSYGNISVTISDDAGNTLYLYRLSTKVALGDFITVTGKVGSYNGSKQIAAGATAVIGGEDSDNTDSVRVKDSAFVEIEIPESDRVILNHTATKNGTLIISSANAGVRFALLNADGSLAAPYATRVKLNVQAGEITTVAVMMDDNTAATVTVSCELIPEPVDNSLITANKTVADLITEYGWNDTTTKQSFKLDDIVSVVINGGNNSGKAYNGNHIRIYATDTPAGTMTISVADGYELVSIKITTQTGTYAFLCVNGSDTDISNELTAVSGSSVVLNSVKNGANGKQVRVTAIEVNYVATGAEAPEDTTESETTVTEPETTVTEPETTVTEPETTVTEPETTVTEPETTVTEPETTVTEPETEATEPETETSEPAADSVLTIEQAIALGNTFEKSAYTEGKYYVTGTVIEIQNTTYGNLVISDGTNSILVYGIYDATGATRYDKMATKPVVGDTITVYGVVGMYNDAQLKNAWLTAHTAHTCEFVDGACSLCGAIDPDSEIKFAELEFVATNRTSMTTETAVWEANGIKLTQNKVKGSNIGDYAAPARIYKGHSVLIESAGMTKIVFEATGTADHISGIQQTLATLENCTVTVDGKIFTVTFNAPVDSLSLSAAAQFRLNSIQVYY